MAINDKAYGYAGSFPDEYRWAGFGINKVAASVPMSGATYTQAEVTKLLATERSNALITGRADGFTSGNAAARRTFDDAKDAWIIISRVAGDLTPATNPRVYVSKTQAMKVADELAKKAPGTEFIVLRYVAVVRAPVMTTPPPTVTTI